MSAPVTLQDRVAWETASGGDTRLVSEKILLSRIARPPSSAGFESLQPLESFEALSRFSKLDNELRSLQREPESDEFGLVRPSAASVKRVKEALFPLVQRGVGFPETRDVGTDHDGAIRVVWENGPRFLELVAPCEDDAAAYFYYSEGDQFGLQKDLTADMVRRRFNWLYGAG
jgi:hypothetical protein